MDDPTTSPAEPREIGVPEIMVAGALGSSMVPATTASSFAACSILWPATVGSGGLDEESAVAKVDAPTTKPLCPRLTGVPEIVTPGLPVDIVVPAMTILPCVSAWTCWPPINGGIGAGNEAGSAIVDVPTTKPLSPREHILHRSHPQNQTTLT